MAGSQYFHLLLINYLYYPGLPSPHLKSYLWRSFYFFTFRSMDMPFGKKDRYKSECMWLIVRANLFTKWLLFQIGAASRDRLVMLLSASPNFSHLFLSSAFLLVMMQKKDLLYRWMSKNLKVYQQNHIFGIFTNGMLHS